MCEIIYFRETGRLAWLFDTAALPWEKFGLYPLARRKPCCFQRMMFVSETGKCCEKIQKQRIFSHKKKEFSRKAHLALFPYKKCVRKVIFCMESADFRRFTKIPDSRIVHRQTPAIGPGNQDEYVRAYNNDTLINSCIFHKKIDKKLTFLKAIDSFYYLGYNYTYIIND